MSLLINSMCIACDSCISKCPSGAIREGDPVYKISPSICTECVGYSDRPMCVDVCPVDAIVPDPRRRETVEQLRARFDRLSSV